MKWLVALLVVGSAGLWWAPAPATQVAAVLLTIIPGFLLLLALPRVRVQPLLAILAGVGLTYVAGIVANTVAAFVAIPQEPWLPWAVQSGMGVVLLAISWRRLSGFGWESLPPLSARTVLGGAILAALPVAAVLSAVAMNNTGEPFATIATLLGVSAVILWCVLVPTGRLVPLGIYSSALSIILLGAFRSDFLSGTDLSSEYFLANLTRATGYWTPGLSDNAYNATLSVTILPHYFADLFVVPLATAFQLLIPAMYALVPVIIYTMFRQHHHPTLGVLAFLIYIAQPTFVTWSPVPGRQMVAFLFFAAMVWSIFDTTAGRRERSVRVLLFGALVIVSHYSTGYVALTLLVFGTALAQIVHWWISRRRTDDAPAGMRATWPVILALVAIAIAWFGPVTQVGNNLVTTARSSVAIMQVTGFNPFNAVGYASGTGLANQLGIAAQSQDPAQVLRDYEDFVQRKVADAGVPTLMERDQAAPAQVEMPAVRPAEATPAGQALVIANEAIRDVMRVFLVLGLLLLIWQIWRREPEGVGMPPYVLTAGAILVAVIVIPELSIEYDLGRTTQQLMILLALPILLGARLIVKALTLGRASDRASAIFVAVLAFALCAFSTGVVNVATGATRPAMMVSDSGDMYEQISVTEGELAAARWLEAHREEGVPVASGYFSGTRLALAGIERPQQFRDVFAWSVPTDSYLFRGAYEIASGNASFYYEGTYVKYPYPLAEIATAKDIIYANSSAEIYR